MDRRWYRVTCPPPDRRLKPNRRVNLHRMERWKLEQAAKAWARVAGLEALGGRGAPPPMLAAAWVRVQIVHPSMRDWTDPDGALAWLKPTVDGLEAAGMFTNDRQISYLPIEQHLRRKQQPVVVLDVVEILNGDLCKVVDLHGEHVLGVAPGVVTGPAPSASETAAPGPAPAGASGHQHLDDSTRR